MERRRLIRHDGAVDTATAVYDASLAGLAVVLTTLAIAFLGASPALAPVYAVPIVIMMIARGMPAGMQAGILCVVSFECYLMPVWHPGVGAAAIFAGAAGVLAFIFGHWFALRDARSAAANDNHSYAVGAYKGAVEARQLMRDMGATGANYLLTFRLEKMVKAGTWGAAEIGFASELGSTLVQYRSVANDNADDRCGDGRIIEAGDEIRAGPVGDDDVWRDELAKH